MVAVACGRRAHWGPPRKIQQAHSLAREWRMHKNDSFGAAPITSKPRNSLDCTTTTTGQRDVTPPRNATERPPGSMREGSVPPMMRQRLTSAITRSHPQASMKQRAPGQRDSWGWGRPPARGDRRLRQAHIGSISWPAEGPATCARRTTPDHTTQLNNCRMPWRRCSECTHSLVIGSRPMQVQLIAVLAIMGSY